MGKRNKWRNKQYRGKDAADFRPSVIRVKAPNRSRFGTWVHDNKDNLKIRGLQLGVVVIVSLIFFWLVF